MCESQDEKDNTGYLIVGAEWMYVCGWDRGQIKPRSKAGRAKKKRKRQIKPLLVCVCFNARVIKRVATSLQVSGVKPRFSFLQRSNPYSPWSLMLRCPSALLSPTPFTSATGKFIYLCLAAFLTPSNCFALSALFSPSDSPVLLFLRLSLYQMVLKKQYFQLWMCMCPHPRLLGRNVGPFLCLPAVCVSVS